MSAVEITEVIKFLSTTLPFQFLDRNDLRKAASYISIEYLKSGRFVSVDDASNRSLHVIRRGAFEIRSSEGHLVDRIADGECYGISTVLENNPEGFSVVPLEDSLVYKITKDNFQSLCDSNPQFHEFFNQTRANRLKKLSTSKSDSVTPNLQLNTTVKTLMAADVIHIAKSATVAEAAKKMSTHRVSSILILKGPELDGILTDRDLRARVLAEAKSPDTLVSEVMTSNPSSINVNSLAIHAQLIMSEKNIHHLPIIDDRQNVVGMLTSTDLLRNQQLSPLLLASEINRKQSMEDVVKVMTRLPKLISNLVSSEMKPQDIGQVIATIADSLARKLIKIYRKLHGEPPMEFNMLVFGSQARFDQSLGSDQDNGFMLEREPTDEELDYFKAMGQFLSDGLDQCGFEYCPGDIMASNPKWIMSRTQWQAKFRKWIESPSPQALLNASIFFDIRSVIGPSEPVQELKETMATHARKNGIFLATLTKNALRNRAPLGFFRDFVVDREGVHKDELDLKHHGLAMINDLARIYALASGSLETSTTRRLQDAVVAKVLPKEHAMNLEDGWEFLSELRNLAQQIGWQDRGEASPYLDPASLSQLERNHLKSTFKLITQGLDSTQNSFARGMGCC